MNVVFLYLNSSQMCQLFHFSNVCEMSNHRLVDMCSVTTPFMLFGTVYLFGSSHFVLLY
jgi:hypothetical protein